MPKLCTLSGILAGYLYLKSVLQSGNLCTCQLDETDPRFSEMNFDQRMLLFKYLESHIMIPSNSKPEGLDAFRGEVL